MKNGKVKKLCYIIGLLVLIQFLLFGIKHIVLIFIERTDYTDRIVSMVGMIILSAMFVFFAKN